MIQQQAKAAGFDVRLQPTNQADFFAGKNLGPNDYEVVLLYWVAPGAEIFRIADLPHTGHLARGLSVIFWNFSKACP